MVKTVRKIWEAIRRFKHRCRIRGWGVIEREDVIESKEEFHNILWTRKIHSSTFKSVASKKIYAVKKGTSYRPIDVSYNAWICATPLSEPLKKTIDENPQLLDRNAVYDLSGIGVKRAAKKLNKTGSQVFQEFERFLKDELRFELKTIRIQVTKGDL